jgi:hypothetical protein
MISMEPRLSPPTTMRRKKKERRGWIAVIDSKNLFFS